tara:strand:+ start:879 stop:2081 length:1203 start_codon:yes stop_codon:yes gene_type:complete
MFSSIFVLSYLKIVNIWSFSQAHVNYSEGFIKRGLFGTLMFFFEEKFYLPTKIFFSSFFMFFYLLNIFLFFALIKKYLSNKLLFIFLALSPTLIMFSFNDLGGYQRLDVLSIAAILIHALISQKYYEKKIDLNFYQKILFYFIFPFIFISILFHEIQLFSLPFHFFVTWNILKDNFFSIIKRYLIFLIPIYLVFFIYPDPESIILMEKNIGGRGIYSSALLFHTKNIGLVHYLHEININILNINNLKMHLLMILLATTPFILILLYFNKLNLLISDNEINYKFIFFVTFPFLAGLLIGDFGRWINIMSFTAFGYMSQFPLKFKLNDFKLFNDEIYKFIVNFILLSLTIFYLFFIRIPHCCNLEKLNINLYGGIVNKGISIINVLFNSEEGGLYDLDARFK